MNNEDIIITYPNPTCNKCNTKRYLMFYNGMVRCSNCNEIIWEVKKK